MRIYVSQPYSGFDENFNSQPNIILAKEQKKMTDSVYQPFLFCFFIKIKSYHTVQATELRPDDLYQDEQLPTRTCVPVLYHLIQDIRVPLQDYSE